MSIVFLAFSFCLSCKKETLSNFSETLDNIPTTTRFVYPVGFPDGDGYYNAQPFGENNHLGDDWNGLGGGDSDLGDPIYAIGEGLVISAKDEGSGWGNVIRIVHILEDGKSIESLYAHCNEILISNGETVTTGQKIATIGNANGAYLAHLHFELRDKLGMPLGQGYNQDNTGYLNGSEFIKASHN